MARTTLIISLDGAPIAKGRPRGSIGKDGKPHFHTPKATKSYENALGMTALSCMNKLGGGKWTGRLQVYVEAHVAVPKSWSAEKRDWALKNRISPGKPDLDNYVKIVLDALNGVVYDDDSQVQRIMAYKKYSRAPQMYVAIKELEI